MELPGSCVEREGRDRETSESEREGGICGGLCTGGGYIKCRCRVGGRSEGGSDVPLSNSLPFSSSTGKRRKKREREREIQERLCSFLFNRRHPPLFILLLLLHCLRLSISKAGDKHCALHVCVCVVDRVIWRRMDKTFLCVCVFVWSRQFQSVFQPIQSEHSIIEPSQSVHLIVCPSLSCGN